MLSLKLISFIFVILCCSDAHADGLMISSFDCNGVSWTSAETKGTFTVEWSATPTGQWNSSWNNLGAIEATGGQYNVAVPFFFRVAYHPSITVRNETNGLAKDYLTKYWGYLDKTEIEQASLLITIGESYVVDNGNGALSGSAGTTGMINYKTGFFMIDNNGKSFGSNVPVVANIYSYIESDAVVIYDEVQRYTAKGITAYAGVLSNAPIVQSSLIINAAGMFYSESDPGVLLGESLGNGTINYETGLWTIDLNGIVLEEGHPIRATYMTR